MGQFLTLNDEVPRGELQEKNDIPVHKELYKMVAVHKDGFSLGVQNILTGSVQEILHSKLSPLNLELLEELSYSTPQTYKTWSNLPIWWETNINQATEDSKAFSSFTMA